MAHQLTKTEIAQLDYLKEEIQKYPLERSQLLPILQKVQEEIGYIPQEAMTWVANYLTLPLAEIYGVVSFYNQFKEHPPGEYAIKVCLGTACHVRGADIILENFERKLKIKEGETTSDRKFSLERVACVGCCALAPVAMVGKTTYPSMMPSKVEGFFTQVQVAEEIAARKKKS